ncbi:gliding motility protein GldN [Mucilaginibacter sp. Bleaf8]|uniref:type IX secretion system ring protein PorN/GldN n=1 Tax=Mucilaginibacter sp. Bleaf8 TaxID=2834430 RepID=UPI001BD1B272|nr:gliding motility protein GldN [Mucilaginibacter sp. Bleaf8]MBS7567029.1 gliding motility protein GldN [Mucilaginibacter sp. Bleaf8]
MKNLAYKVCVSAFCALSIVATCTTADAQKRSKSKSTKSRTTKAKRSTYYNDPQSNYTAPSTGATSTPANTAVTDSLDMLPVDSIVPVDGFMKNTAFSNAKAFAYPSVESTNVKFYKRVWRDIDTKDKKNYLFDAPGATLADIVMEGVRTGKLSAYEASMTNSDNTFARRLTIRQALSKLQDSAMVDQFDQDGNKIGSKMVLNDFNPEKITKFRVKEDVYFDKKRSVVVTRIIGIAPLMSLQAGGQNIGESPAFWLYFPQCRNFFAGKDVSDPDRNLYDTSMDDIFVQRRYASTVVRASGANGNTTTASAFAQAGVAAAPSAEDAAKEKEENAKQVEAKIQSYKQNLWQYKLQTKAEKEKASKKEKAAKDAKPAKAEKTDKTKAS